MINWFYHQFAFFKNSVAIKELCTLIEGFGSKQLRDYYKLVMVKCVAGKKRCFLEFMHNEIHWLARSIVTAWSFHSNHKKSSWIFPTLAIAGKYILLSHILAPACSSQGILDYTGTKTFTTEPWWAKLLWKSGIKSRLGSTKNTASTAACGQLSNSFCHFKHKKDAEFLFLSSL